jgi:hypothetical protein
MLWMSGLGSRIEKRNGYEIRGRGRYERILRVRGHFIYPSFTVSPSGRHSRNYVLYVSCVKAVVLKAQLTPDMPVICQGTGAYLGYTVFVLTRNPDIRVQKVNREALQAYL